MTKRLTCFDDILDQLMNIGVVLVAILVGLRAFGASAPNQDKDEILQNVLGQLSSAPNPVTALPAIRQKLDELGPSMALITSLDQEYRFVTEVFGDGHGVAQATQPTQAMLGTYLVRRGQKIFVDAILAGSPADQAGLLVGDEVLAIDGEPPSFLPVIHAKPDIKQRWEVRRFLDSTLTLVLRPKSQSLTSALAVDMEDSVRFDAKAGRSIAYLRLPATFDPIFAEVARKIVHKNLLASARVLILDLRGPFGPVGVSQRELWCGPERLFKGPMIVLIDGGTRGGREWLAWSLEKDHNAILIGEPTAGAWAPSYWQKINLSPQQSAFFTAGLLRPKGPGKNFAQALQKKAQATPVEGRGLTPRHWVKRTIAYSGGSDAPLEAAFSVASAIVGTKPVPGLRSGTSPKSPSPALNH